MAHYSCDNINHLSSLTPLSPSQPDNIILSQEFFHHETFQIMLMTVKENSMEIKLITGHFMSILHKLNENKVAIVFSEPFTN
jgi:cystathionine beta-lyase/cystathionine gamma-synthase